MFDVDLPLLASGAFSGAGAVSDIVITGIRFLLGALAGLLGWFFSTPLVRLVYKLAFQKEPSRTAESVGRLSVAALLFVLVFFLAPIGGSGGGFGAGPGPGGGPGQGTGLGSGAGTGPAQPTGGGTGTGTGIGGVSPGSVPLVLEMIHKDRYKGDGKLFLVQGKAPPLSLKEVEDFVTRTRDQWSRLTVVAYMKSIDFEPDREALERLARRLNLNAGFDRLRNIDKTPE